MTQKDTLSPSMSVSQFDNGYWYATELKAFAKKLGISPVSRLRKDQLEKQIRHYLSEGTLPSQLTPSISKHKAPKQSDDLPLSLAKPIINYKSNKVTKTFILNEAKKIQANFPKKSGVWYWLNRWRETQLNQNNQISYDDLVNQFLKLSNQKGRLPRIPSTRFNNFITDYLAEHEGKRQEALEIWETLKQLDIPKTYAAWKQYKEQDTRNA